MHLAWWLRYTLGHPHIPSQSAWIPISALLLTPGYLKRKQMMAKVLGSFKIMLEIQMEFFTPGFGLPQFRLCRHSGNEQKNLCLTAFQIN